MNFNKEQLRYLIVFPLIVSVYFFAFILPKKETPATNFVSQFKIPYKFSVWHGKDIYQELNLKDEIFRFLTEVVARIYRSNDGEKIRFFILNAQNFHFPNQCFTGAGFKVKELDKTEFHTPYTKFKAHTLYTEKGREKYLIIYWITINKRIFLDWANYHVEQVFLSIFDRKGIGLMMRLDVPLIDEDIDKTLSFAQKFIYDLSNVISQDERYRIFGKEN